MIFTATPATGPLTGTVRVPGDKSISHRAVLFAAMAEGTSRLTGVLDSADVRSTLDAVAALGAEVAIEPDRGSGLDVTVTGWGERGPRQLSAGIDCGNSGTTCRLLMGVLASWPVIVTLDGDSSLRRRPMRRVIEPLSSMGASFVSTDGHLPVIVSGAELRALRYESPVASAQVKTAILIAGLRAQGVTTVIEPAPSRDHTERLLPAFGVGVGRDAASHACWVEGTEDLEASDVTVPADPSSAAFIAGAAVVVPGSEIRLPDVALNPTRTGFLRVLERMGASVETFVGTATGAEPAGTVTVRYAEGLHGTTVRAEEVPSLVDEVPLLAVVACSASGVTRFEGVSELRVKESDRLSAIANGLTSLGATVRTGDDWLEVEGPTQLHGASLSSLGDHRLAMAWAVAALTADAPVEIALWEAVDVSYPSFERDLASLSRR
jgi:3-phosphoshikimate 1-carboxyvinyltransferase